MTHRLSDVIGHHAAVKQFKAAIHADKLHHAYLLSGPRGIGRTTLAQALLASLVCDERGDDACGDCKSCRQLAASAHPNIKIVGDGETPVKVADIRELIRWVSLKTIGGGHRTILLRGIESLGVPAANALLKTLEEPPPSTTFLITTASLQQLLPTIRSRCQVVRLRPLAIDDVQKVLETRSGLSPEEAARLARLSGGKPGLALALTEDALQERSDMLAALLSPPQGIKARLDAAESWGKDPLKVQRLLDLFESVLRDAWVYRVAPKTAWVNPDADIPRFANSQTPRSLHQLHQKIRAGRRALSLHVTGRVVMETLFLSL